MMPPPRTLDQVRTSLETAKAYGTDRKMASMMLRHGRLTDDARNYVAQYLEGK